MSVARAITATKRTSRSTRVRPICPSAAAVRLIAAAGLALAASAATLLAQPAFTIVAIPDTQNYSTAGAQGNLTTAGLFGRQTQWIVSNASNPSFNIVFATHLGDVVNNAGVPGGAATNEWPTAVNAMATLRNSTVPYSVLPGNHEWTSSGGSGSLEHYRPRFGNTSTFFINPGTGQPQPWFLGFDQRGVNSAQRFTTPIGDFLHIALEFNAAQPSQSSDFGPGIPSSPMAWAQGVIDANPGIPTIISTHNNVNTTGVRDSRGTQLFNTLVRNNNQVFMVLNGHYHNGNLGEARINSTNDFGRPVFEILSDYQSRARGGDGWFRLYTFEPANNRIVARTYSVASDATLGQPAGPLFNNTGREEVDADSFFELPLNFATRFIAPPPPPPPAPVPAGEGRSFRQGEAGYSGAIDLEIRQPNPDTNYNGAVSMTIDLDDASGTLDDTQGLIRFDQIFGAGAGQIPAGRGVLSATLSLSVSNPGSGIDFHRVLRTWGTNATWNNLTGGISPTGGVEVLAFQDSSNPGIGTGTLTVPVTRALRSWNLGTPNQGWAMIALGTDGVDIDTAEALTVGNRPRLSVTVTRDAMNVSRFRQGLDGYAGTVATTLDQNAPGTSRGTNPVLEVDASVTDNANAAGPDQLALIRFEGLVGPGAGQVRPNARIAQATLRLNIDAAVGASDGSGLAVHRMTAPWDASSTWNSLGNGVTIGTETLSRVDDQLGINVLNQVNVVPGRYDLDVTASVQDWVNNNEPNLGWALMPLAQGTNAVRLDGPLASLASSVAPELVVLWQPSPCGAADIASPGPVVGADGELTADDVLQFISWFTAGDARADIAVPGPAAGSDGEFTADDILLFIGRFTAGC
jgi:hypothetical protein